MIRFRVAWIAILGILLGTVCLAQSKPKSFTVVFKDGHQKSFSMSDVSRIEFKNNAMVVTHSDRQESIPVADIVRMDFDTAANTSKLGRNHFVGKWEFGQGPGLDNFIVTLDPNGQAHKSIGAPHGTWVAVDGEAHISWDDGWKDVIRKVGSKHEKFAYEPGKSLTDNPSNVTFAKSLNSEPI